MKDKVVEYFGGEILHEVRTAMGEARNMQRNYGFLSDGTAPGAGLDMCCLVERLRKAEKLLELIAPDSMSDTE